MLSSNATLRPAARTATASPREPAGAAVLPGDDAASLGAPVPDAPRMESSLATRRPLRVLTLTTLYPSAVRPRHGIFVETRLRKLVATGKVTADVVAPVPWFPSTAEVFGSYAKLAATPRQESRFGLEVRHPRYLMLPSVGAYVQPWTLARAFLAEARAMVARGRAYDLVDAHYFYPDGVAAVRVARTLGLPVVITARGSDINLIAKLPWYGRWVRDAAQRADHIIAVSQALKSAICDLGIDAAKVTVLRNGVDMEVFSPRPVEEAKAHVGMTGRRVVLSVGNLVPEKGHDLVVRSVAALDDVQLVIVGEGPEQQRLGELAAACGIAARVHMRPNVTQRELAAYYSAADVLALGSTREGWPNVLLEALACGTPVVSTRVGGVPEIVRAPVAGAVVEGRDPAAFAQAISRVMASAPARADVRAYASAFDWQAVSDGQLEVFESLSRTKERS